MVQNTQQLWTKAMPTDIEKIVADWKTSEEAEYLSSTAVEIIGDWWLAKSTSLAQATKEELLATLAGGVERKEEGQTERCKDVLEMNYLIGRNKGFNEAVDAYSKLINDLRGK